MSADLVILVPVLDRPHRVQPLLDSIEAATPEARVIFICDRDDEAEQDAVAEAVQQQGRSLTVCGMVVVGNYARKVNEGIRRTSEPLIFTGADDLDFRPGWLEAARRPIDRGAAAVVGTQDLCNQRVIRGEHATHFLVSREYAEQPQWDGSAGLLCEAYAHNCVDDELVDTATSRGAYVFVEEAVVEHLHPLVGKAPVDPTYEKGTGLIRADRKLFRARRSEWRA